MSHDRSPADPALLEKSYYLTSRLFEVKAEHKGYDMFSPKLPVKRFQALPLPDRGSTVLKSLAGPLVSCRPMQR
jgi:hypothetical protein